MSFAEDQESKLGTTRYLRHVRTVYEIQPIVSGDLWRVGFAALEGSAAYQAEVQAWDKEGRRMRAGLTSDLAPSEQMAISSKIAEYEQTAGHRAIQHFMAHASSRDSWMKRCDAHICASIVGGCHLGSDAPDYTDDFRFVDVLPEEWGVAPDGVDRSFRYVLTEEEADPTAGKVFVGRLGEQNRLQLGSTLISVRTAGPRLEVAPFCPGSEAVRVDGRAGEEVREVAIRAPDDVTGGCGDQPGLHDGGGGSGSGTGDQIQGDGGLRPERVTGGAAA